MKKTLLFLAFIGLSCAVFAAQQGDQELLQISCNRGEFSDDEELLSDVEKAVNKGWMYNEELIPKLDGTPQWQVSVKNAMSKVGRALSRFFGPRTRRKKIPRKRESLLWLFGKKRRITISEEVQKYKEVLRALRDLEANWKREFKQKHRWVIFSFRKAFSNRAKNGEVRWQSFQEQALKLPRPEDLKRGNCGLTCGEWFSVKRYWRIYQKEMLNHNIKEVSNSGIEEDFLFSMD